MTTPNPSSSKRRVRLHPVLVMLSMLLVALVLTHVVPAGRYDRHLERVVPGSYEVLPKVNGLPAFLSPTAPSQADFPARAAGIVALFTAIPEGMTKAAGLMFMVMFVGGMFGVLQATGAIESGIDRLLHLTSGNVYLLTGALMFVLACGATFLGLFSEYLAVVPLLLTVTQRLQLPNLFAAAVALLSAGVGYAASVTNPIVLAVAQPLAMVPVFSGILPRLAIFLVMFAIGLTYMLLYLRRAPKAVHVPEASQLSARHIAVLLCVLAGAAVLVIGTSLWAWGTAEHGAVFIAWAVALAFAGRMGAGASADAFIDGMKLMVLPSVMIGLAGGLAVLLQSSQVLDSVVHTFAVAVEGRSPSVVVSGIMIGEMALDLLINSTGAKAAISLPILTPIAQLSGIGGNVSVSALTLGGSITNLITPTNGVLLAFLAAAKVDYIDWARFVAPLLIVMSVVALVALQIMVILEVQ